MKRQDVKVGNVYTVRVSGNLVKVRVTEDLGVHQLYVRGTPKKKHRGWSGVNLKTGREVHIRSAAKLRMEVSGALPQ